MSHVMVDDQSSCLKQFGWEELDADFFIAVIFRAGRRYVAQRHFEQQLFFVKSPVIQEKWRRAFYDVMSKCLSPLYITSNEANLINEINTWHLNWSNQFCKINARIDYLIDFEDLFDSSITVTMVGSSASPSFLFQPITTLEAASRTIEMWKERQDRLIDDTYSNPTVSKSLSKSNPSTSHVCPVVPGTSSPSSFTSGWLQLDAKIVPYIEHKSIRFLSIDYLLKEHFLTSFEEFSLRSSYVPIEPDQIDLFNRLIRQISSASHPLVLTKYSSLIRLDEFLFRLKRLFFLRFLSSLSIGNLIDSHQIMSMNGGLVTLNNQSQRIPFIYIKRQKYIPCLNPHASSALSKFSMASTFELEYLRLISIYESLSSGKKDEYLTFLLSVKSLMLIPLESAYDENQVTTMSLNDFHYHEYQRRAQHQQQQQQQQQAYFQSSNEDPSMVHGWWQTPVSSKAKRSFDHFKFHPPIYF